MQNSFYIFLDQVLVASSHYDVKHIASALPRSYENLEGQAGDLRIRQGAQG